MVEFNVANSVMTSVLSPNREEPPADERPSMQIAYALFRKGIPAMTDEIKVAYVEDEPSIARLLASGLGLFGITVRPIFMSAEELLDNSDEQDFRDANILMFDIRLPKMTGVELASELRKRGEERPMVLVSAWPSPSKAKLEEIEAVFLPKPFDFPDVVQTIQSLA